MTPRYLTFGMLACAVVAAACTGSISGSDGDGTGNPPNNGQNPVGGASSGGGTGPTPEEIEQIKGKFAINGTPKYFRVIRLTNEQWTNSVQSVLGLASPPTLAEAFQSSVTGLTDFSNNENALADIDMRGWSDYQGAAETLATQVTSDAAQLSKLYAGTDGAGFIAAVGKRIYRRPLVAAETAAYQKLFDSGASLSGSRSAFAKGASVVLEAMLQSPYFLYRSELGAAGAPLSTYEVAAKLSLLLRDTTPDDALLQAAAAPGKLDTADGIAAIAEKMLEEPAAKRVMRRFHGEWLEFGKFAELTKAGVASYDPKMKDEFAESSYLFFDRLFGQGLGVKDIFTSTTGFVGQTTAALYGGAAAPASGFMERDFGPSRAGFFQQVPFLALYGRNEGPDSIHRGKTMSLSVLCAPLGFFVGEIPPLPDSKPGQTNRVRVDEHTKVCGSQCHNNMINPLGFAFEHFDGMGQYRDKEVNQGQELAIDSSGSFNFIDGPKTYQNAADLMQVLATDPQTHLCYSKKLASFSLQRDLTEADLPLLTELSSKSTSASASIKAVVLDLVKQDAFRIRSGGAL
jgi:hypothetical protein